MKNEWIWTIEYKPNIVYILADDMGYGDLSCLNPESKIRTPNLDRLAAGGMTFTDAHASSAVCTPSRYSILTGRYNWRSRLKQSVLFGYDPHLIEPGRMTVASFLKAQGYHTAMIGKWHPGWDWATTDGQPAAKDGANVDFSAPVTGGPDDCGFDYYFGHCGSLDMAPYVYVENGRVTAPPDRITVNEEKFTFWREGPTGADFVHEDVSPNFTRRGVKYIGELAAFGHHPSYIFRRHKADIYEGGHRIPLLIQWPERIEAGSVSDETVCLSDLLATCADLLGTPLPDNAGEDSVSNLPVWRGQS